MIMATDNRGSGSNRAGPKFLFTSAGGRAWEARQNAQAARETLRRLVPERAPEGSEPPPSTSASGACFRRVMALLANKGRWGR